MVFSLRVMHINYKLSINVSPFKSSWTTWSVCSTVTTQFLVQHVQLRVTSSKPSPKQSSTLIQGSLYFWFEVNYAVMVGLLIKKPCFCSHAWNENGHKNRELVFLGNTIDLTLFFVVGPIQIIPETFMALFRPTFRVAFLIFWFLIFKPYLPWTDKLIKKRLSLCDTLSTHPKMSH